MCNQGRPATRKEKVRYLSRYKQMLMRETETIENIEMLRMRYMATPTKLIDDMPHSHNAEHDLSEYAAEVDELFRELNEQMSEAHKIRREIISRIEAIEDEQFVTLLRLVYLHDKDLHTVADTLCISYDWAKHLHGHALDAMELNI